MSVKDIAEIKHMMKTIQTKIKNGSDLLSNDMQSGGSGSYNFMKKYLDMVFSNEQQLKQDQQDSLERLNKIKEAERKKEDEANKQKRFEEENELLAQNERNIQDAKENSQKIREQAQQVEQEKNEALQKAMVAKQQADDAEKYVEETETYNKILEDAINIRKKHVQNSEIIMQQILKTLANKELVSLEETKEAIVENAAIQNIQTPIENLEIKIDDLLI
jgi:chemotaxis protein histidine kinase CheA